MTDRPTKDGADGLPDHVRRNRAAWDLKAAEYEAPGRRAWARTEPDWGIWGVPESELASCRTSPASMSSSLTAAGRLYVSAWLARRGARPVGIDNSAVQLANARRFQAEYGIEFPLLHGNAETVPCPDASFDLAISEYGACLWADPDAWVPEAGRLLRPGGRLIFLTNAATVMLCSPDDEHEPATDRMLRPFGGIWRAALVSPPHGNWTRCSRHGFEVRT